MSQRVGSLTKLTINEVNFVIYHDPCSDGFASAFIIHMYMQKNYPDRVVTYYKGSHGKLPPDVTGKNVLICDFSYKYDTMLNIMNKANKLLIIDHHKSAQKDLEKIPEINKIFDMNHSGAMLTWFYVFADDKYKKDSPPLLIKYIEDRDLWTKKLPNIDEFVSWFYISVPFEFSEYAKYLDESLLLEKIKTLGKYYKELNDINISQAAKYAIVKFMFINGKYYFVAYVNSTVLKSDIGSKILELKPYCDFSVVYSIGDYNNNTSFSLRSDSEHVDVSEIAFSMQGGGHRNAAGVGVSYVTNKLPADLIDNGELYKTLESVYFDSINIEGKIFNVTYLNSSICKSQLAQYLLQTKYVDANGQPIEEATYIRIRSNSINKLEPDDKLLPVDKLHLSVVWNSDKGKSYHTICFNSCLSNGDKELLSNYFKRDKTLDIIIL
jgi:oligoribonuclease NrnB/cAMP/cGMP phosphodiesterase (DHH superfamily)